MTKAIKVFKTSDEDSWGNPIWKNCDTNEIYLDIKWNDEKPDLHSVTDLGEPNCPIKNFKIVK